MLILQDVYQPLRFESAFVGPIDNDCSLWGNPTVALIDHPNNLLESIHCPPCRVLYHILPLSTH